jgi:hypothetical protein
MLVLGQTPRIFAWMHDRIGINNTEDTRCIGWERDGELVAGCLFNNWNETSVCMHIASEGRSWLTRKFLFACFDYPFNEAGKKIVLGHVGSKNFDALRFDLHLGFKHHTTIPDAHPDGALHILTMRREDCRWIRN